METIQWNYIAMVPLTGALGSDYGCLDKGIWKKCLPRGCVMGGCPFSLPIIECPVRNPMAYRKPRDSYD